MVEAPALELTAKITTSLKALGVIDRDSVVSMTSLRDVMNAEDGMTTAPIVDKIPTKNIVGMRMGRMGFIVPSVAIV